MATSALITLEGFPKFSLYRHHDGYPSGTLPFLTFFNERFTKIRGNDLEYKAAQLVRATIIYGEQFHLCMDETCGWGICPDANISVDFYYTLHGDGSVTYRKC